MVVAPSIVSSAPTVFSSLMNLKNKIHRQNLLLKSCDVSFFVDCTPALENS